MQYGFFDDKNREYVIERPDTPRSWSNYLGSTEYGAIITNNAGGYSFYKSAAQGRFMRLRFNVIPMDQPGRYFYIHDKDKKDFLGELNVIEQAINVCQTNIVQDAWKKGKDLTIHGWIYDLHDGLLNDLGVCVSNKDELREIYFKSVSDAFESYLK